MLFLDEFIMQSNKLDSQQILNEMKTYFSFLCKTLINPTEVYESNSNLIYYAVDYHSFHTNGKNQINSPQEFIRIAGEERPEVANYMTLEPSVTNFFKDWMCGQSLTGINGQVKDSGNCVGVCIASAEFNFNNEIIESLSGGSAEYRHKLWSPLLYIELNSPISGQKVTDQLKENILNTNSLLSFVLPLDQSQAIRNIDTLSRVRLVFWNYLSFNQVLRLYIWNRM